MSHAFIAYIDEAGDEGFKIVRRPQRKSSEWFFISAAIVPYRSVPSLDNIIPNALKASLPKKLFHFREADHIQRVKVLEHLRYKPITLVSIAVHKPSIPEESALRKNKHYVFHYATKLLVERVSWYCRDHKEETRGVAKLVFSERGQLSEERLRTHFDKLKDGGKAKSAISWPNIDLDSIEIKRHRDLAGLQIADAVVSSLEQAMELSIHSTTEHRYMKILRGNYYRRNNRCSGYGLKFMPGKPDDDPWEPDRLHWTHHYK
jgi:hypothetical protein